MYIPNCKYFIVVCSIFLLLFGCAKIVTPTGGPKDVTPPKVIAEKPENGATKFSGKSIKITFDEFVTLNNPIENVIFSPPLGERIDYATKGKSIVIKLNDTLKVNTTYNILFSDCIQDFHEGNKLVGYDYAFSTGDSIDDAKLFGIVENAETFKPEKGCFVMLYTEYVDSLPLTTRPHYLTKTNDKGIFVFNHLKNQLYKIFVLKDINSNLKYDLPNESISFLEEMVAASYYKNESTVALDSAQHLHLLLFTEEDTAQLKQPEINPQKGLHRFPYKKPLKSYSLQFENAADLEYFDFINETKDTISLYLKNHFEDSLVLYITRDESFIDTLELHPFKNTTKIGRNRTIQIPKLSITVINKDELYKPTILNFSYPIRQIDSAELLIVSEIKAKNDTAIVYFSVKDTFTTNITILFFFEPKIKYTILLKDSLLWGYDETTHDSLNVVITKKNEKDYGNLFVEYLIPGNEYDYIIYLIQGNDKIIQKNTISKSQKIGYQHLPQATYALKIIEDRNRNGKWDTGNYRKKIQPERIIRVKKEVSVRGFWDVEETIDLR